MTNKKPFLNVIRYLIFTGLLSILLSGTAIATPPPKDPPSEAQLLDSGLATLRLADGTSGLRPDANDFVSVHYTIWSSDGTQIESTYDIGEPKNFLLESVLPAWSDGIQLMDVGEKRRLWIPKHLNQTRSGVPQSVICDLELLAMRSVDNLEELTPPDIAQRTAFGAYTRMLRQGEGTGGTSETGAALAHFTLWTENGRVFDSTTARNRPTLFPYDRMMPAFTDVLKAMTIGEKRRIWIPANVAKGNWAGGPQGMLIFDVEILQFMGKDMFTTKGGSSGKSG